MALNQKVGESFKIPVGAHIGTLYSIIDLGMQENTKYRNISHKILLGFEVADVVAPNGMLAVTSLEVSTSTGPKSDLRKLLLAFKPNLQLMPDDEVGELLKQNIGKSIQLLMQESSDNKYTNPAKNFMPVPKGMERKLVNVEPRVWDDVDKITEDQLKTLPEFIQKKIKGRLV